MNEIARGDLYRYYGENKEGIKDRLFRAPQLKYIIQLRKTQACKNKVLFKMNKWRLDRMSRKSLIQIPPEATIG